jgi:blue copper oxidase
MGRPLTPKRIDVVATVDTTEVWTVENSMGSPHNFHVHDMQFQILDIDGAAPPAQLAGWKDTVYLRPDSTYWLIVHFADYADPDHPYMYHCHLLRHEESGMMGQFLVLNPGEAVPDTWTTPTTRTRTRTTRANRTKWRGCTIEPHGRVAGGASSSHRWSPPSPPDPPKLM